METLIGIDVSKKYVDVAFREGGKLKSKRFTGNTQETAQEINDFLGGVQKAVMESTGNYHLKLANGFYQLGSEVYVENPLKIKRYGQMRLTRAKTDSYDSKVILEYGESQPMRAWKPREQGQEELRQTLRALQGLKVTQTEISNRLEALQALPYVSEDVKISLEKVLKSIQHEIAQLTKQLKQKAPKVGGSNYQLLLSIPGVGPVLSACLTAQFGNFEGFSVKQLVASVGLNPAPYESGSSVKGKGGISKRGHGYIRKVLYMAALSAKKHNPDCKALFDRLFEKGDKTSKKKALVAVAHKLLRQAFGVLKNQTPFAPFFHSSKFNEMRT